MNRPPRLQYCFSGLRHRTTLPYDGIPTAPPFLYGAHHITQGLNIDSGRTDLLFKALNFCFFSSNSIDDNLSLTHARDPRNLCVVWGM